MKMHVLYANLSPYLAMQGKVPFASICPCDDTIASVKASDNRTLKLEKPEQK